MGFDPSTAQSDFDPSSAQPEPQSPSQTSQMLGFYEGAMHPFDRAAEALSNIPIVGGAVDRLGQYLGLPSAQQATSQHQQYIAGQEAKGQKPGEWGEFAGSVAGTLPVALATDNPWLLGAGQGALLSDKTDTLGIGEDALKGAALGKLLDFGFGQAIEHGVKPVGRAIARTVSRNLSDDPAAAAAADSGYNYVSGLLDTSGKTSQDLRTFADQSQGKPILSSEAIGRPGMQALTALGRRQGTTPDALEGVLNERAAGRLDRTLDDFATASGINPEAARGNIDAAVQAGQKATSPLYDKAYSRGVVRTKPFSALMQAPGMQSAIGRATTIFGNEYAAARAAGNAGAATPEEWQKFVSGVPDKTAFPTRFLDYVKRGMDSQLESMRDPVTQKLNLRDPLVRSMQDLRSQFVAQARKMNPDYGKALDSAGDYLSAQAAFNNGQRFVFNPNVTAKQFADHFNGLSSGEQEAFKGGVANSLFNKAQNGQIPPGLFKRPILQQKLTAILGDENAQTFFNRMKIENDMAKWGARQAPGTNSVTGDVLNATNEQDRRGLAMDALWAAKHLASGQPLAAAARTASALGRLRAWGQTAGMPVSVRDEAGRLLMMHPSDLADYLDDMSNSVPHALPQIVRALSTLKTPAQIGGTAALVNMNSQRP